MLKFKRILYLISLSSLLLIIYYLSIKTKSNNMFLKSTTQPSRKLPKNEVVIAVVCCGDRLKETLTMLKSAILFSFYALLNIIVVTEEHLITDFMEKLSEWQTLANYSFTFQVKPLSFPINNSAEWRLLFKPCAAQRLFLPSLLPKTDAVLYVDTDTLFLAPPQYVWSIFAKFNSSQLAALSPEHEEPNTGWYNRFAKHPFYGSLGVNSGVMLMNLTRMRTFKWSEYVLPIYTKYRLQLTWGDQDIINILFHFHPDKLYIFSCLYNYRPDHCMYMSVCKPKHSASGSSYDQNEGVVVLHGSRGYFHSNRQPAFEATFRAMQEYQLGTNPYPNFLQVLESYLKETTNTTCGKVQNILLKNSQQYISSLEIS